MTKDEYVVFLKDNIKKLSEMLKDCADLDLTATAIIFAERNRLVDKLYELECKTCPVKFKIGDKEISV